MNEDKYMSSTHGAGGRLCNQIFRNLAVSLVAEKHNLFVNYAEHNRCRQLGLELFAGGNKYTETIMLTDDNYSIILNTPHLLFNLNPIYSYFQTREISRYIYNRLRDESTKARIMSVNPFRHRYNTNNDVFIHFRLGDIAAMGLNPPYEYYKRALLRVPSYDMLYISTDDKEHPIIKRFMQEHPNALMIDCDEVRTIQFANTCQHVILSHGSFSAVIGFLSFFSEVYYPAYELVSKVWFGDMFSIPGWNKVSL